jgi:hypothetical protein
LRDTDQGTIVSKPVLSERSQGQHARLYPEALALLVFSIGPRALGRRSRRGAASGVVTSGAISSRKRASSVEPKGALGSSVPGTRDPKGSTPSVEKALVPRMPGIAGDRTLVLAMPVKALSPAWGKSVGGVSEGSTRGIRARSNPSSNAHRASQRWKASRSAGWR